MDRQRDSDVPVPQPFSCFRVCRSKTHGTRKEGITLTKEEKKQSTLHGLAEAVQELNDLEKRIERKKEMQKK